MYTHQHCFKAIRYYKLRSASICEPRICYCECEFPGSSSKRELSPLLDQDKNDPCLA